jgi:hypothetical protein
MSIISRLVVICVRIAHTSLLIAGHVNPSACPRDDLRADRIVDKSLFHEGNISRCGYDRDKWACGLRQEERILVNDNRSSIVSD